MPAELTFAAAIIVGLLGSTHCLGMCGGIVAALNMGIADDLSKRPISLLGYQLAYNAGRICSYVVVGLLAGTLGASLAELGVSPVAGKLFAAAFMIALGLYLANWWRGLAVLEKLGAHLWRHIQPLAQRLFPIQSPFQAFLLGGLWGWLPCGLVYAVVAWSLTTSNSLRRRAIDARFRTRDPPRHVTRRQRIQLSEGMGTSPRGTDLGRRSDHGFRHLQRGQQLKPIGSSASQSHRFELDFLLPATR